MIKVSVLLVCLFKQVLNPKKKGKKKKKYQNSGTVCFVLTTNKQLVGRCIASFWKPQECLKI